MDLNEDDSIELYDVELASQEAAQLLMVFNGSRVHAQEQYDHGGDDAPPGTYFTSVNADLVHEGHKNRIGIYEVEAGPALHIDDVIADGVLPEGEQIEPEGLAHAVHVDHFFLRRQAPDWLGTIAFALCAMVAHRLGYTHISLVAGGGRGHDPHMIGYRFWPKLGFDALLDADETEGWPGLEACRTVQDVLQIDQDWWRVYGCQRWMEFDLAPDSAAWRKLLNYLREKEMI
ncbi:hypothetical protein [Cupriavidus sp. CuC1]|uniref:hypothetical protein n=1 Tax=Cupriavidus sp. CuC1 TaxID=3373131 RepID=UPI0037CFD85A